LEIQLFTSRGNEVICFIGSVNWFSRQTHRFNGGGHQANRFGNRWKLNGKSYSSKKALQLLFDFAARALQRYQERKEERGLLDFVDLERRTLALLEQLEVTNVIREEFDLLVVDEFQDTNPIQLALFIRLAEVVKLGAVWVGDVKQAIYGFRGGDPALMEAVIRSVRAQGEQSLNTTYRARPELVQLFNDLFIPRPEGLEFGHFPRPRSGLTA